MLHLTSKGKLELYGSEAMFVMPEYPAGSPGVLPANPLRGGTVFNATAAGLKLYAGSPTGWVDVGSTPEAATETTAGIVELATQTEVNTGTDTGRVVTPATLQKKAEETAMLMAVVFG